MATAPAVGDMTLRRAPSMSSGLSERWTWSVILAPSIPHTATQTGD